MSHVVPVSILQTSFLYLGVGVDRGMQWEDDPASQRPGKYVPPTDLLNYHDADARFLRSVSLQTPAIHRYHRR